MDYSGEFPGQRTDSLFMYTQGAPFPIVEIIQQEKLVQNLSLTLAEVTSDTTSPLETQQTG